MSGWFDSQLLRSATTYALSPAYYCSSLFWTVLGYATVSPDRLLRAATHAQTYDRRLTVVVPPEESVTSEGRKTLQREDEDRVMRALREAMLEVEEEGLVERVPATGQTSAAEVDAEETSPATPTEENPLNGRSPSSPDAPAAPASPPLGSSPSPSSPSSPSRPGVRANSRPFSTLSRLSRRSTICLSRLSLYSALESPSPLVPRPVDVEGTGPAARPSDDSDVGAAAEPIPLDVALPSLDEPREEEKELVEELLSEEIEEARVEVEKAVEEALAQQEKEAHDGLPDGTYKPTLGAESTVEPLRETEASWDQLEPPTPSLVRVRAEQEVVETWFSTPAGQSFRGVRISEDGVNAANFLQAVESVLALFGILAPAASSLCAAEVQADIARVRAGLATLPSSNPTVEQLLLAERKKRRRPASDSLLWLLQLLNFGTTSFRQNLDSPTKEELSVSIVKVWEDDFSKHFNWLVRPLFKVLLKACPSRLAVYSKLAQGAPLDQLEREMRDWLDDIERLVERVEGFCKREKIR
ncbi:hypothetical protein JCM10207_001002 [Rhodosporidiobolus poonsookiae]